ncbi:uncharacterized protein EV420DRAFT_1640208 [Desarmillaria tabescens]|uniref:Uncharacterized protein n=1 Tax=Armillaria tabescens TaxID=1929756 RepID=A0AA39T3J0_ARMTA|nr:uncharacterized protein EV420DRAFT_1640208 [Desarmillaria tabescens]KAK0461906.1 hypothetical protein EV420DRAFT_1640208 [Desarmillaria tabescens]
MRDSKDKGKRKITDHFKPVDKGKKENARPAASKKRKQVDEHEPFTKKAKGNGESVARSGRLTSLNGRLDASDGRRNASTSKSPTPIVKHYATPKSMVKGKRNTAAHREEPVIDLTLDDSDNRASTPEPSHTVAPPTPVSIADHGPRHSSNSFFSHRKNTGAALLTTPSTPVRRHVTYSGVSSIPSSHAPTHDSPLKRLSRRHTVHRLRSPSVIPSSQQSQDDEWLGLSITRVATPPSGPAAASQNLPLIPPLAFDENLPEPSSPQHVVPGKDDDRVPEDCVVPTSQSQEISLSQLSPQRILAGLLFSSYMPKPGPLDIVPTSQSQSEVEITSATDISWITSRSLDRNFVRSVSSKGWRALGRSQSDPGLDISHIFEDDDSTARGDNPPAPSMTQYTSSTDSDPEYDDYPFSTNPADRPPVNPTQNSSATESDPDYDAYPFSTNPADRPIVDEEEDGDTTVIASREEDDETGVCPEGSLPDAVKDFRDMFGVGEGSYPEDFPMSLR